MIFKPDWQLAMQEAKDAPVSKWIPASVPGCVQLDYAKHMGWDKDLFFAQNVRRLDGLEEKFWRYRCFPEFKAPEDGERLFFTAKGVDYQFEILINGKTIFEQEGMFTKVGLDLTDSLKAGDMFEILIHPAPKRKGAPRHFREEADACCKPAVSYGWDWHPYLVVLGIWDECFFETRPEKHIKDCEVSYSLSEDYSKAYLTFLPETTGNQAPEYRIWDPDGHEIYAGTNPEVTIFNPRLWWCSEQGKPELYSWQAALSNGSQVSGRFGLRKIELTVNADNWDSENGTRSNPPMTVTLNGRAIFCKGTNWVNPEIFPGIITKDTYHPLLDIAKSAHFNLIRVWGGAIVNKESFFDLCDEKGLMVWQEFPLACNNYIGSPHYLRILEQEARSIVKRVRRHPCHVLWCGGNELFTGWSRMTDQSLAIRLLNKVCFEEDMHTPFLPTSPVMGVSHGYYRFLYPDMLDVMTVMQKKKRMTAYTEFGVPSLAPIDLIKKMIPESELFPPEPGASYEFHHAFNAWDGENNWLQLDILNHYFGKASSLESLIAQTDWLQAEGYKAIYEEARRQKPYASMALNWCFNEPWPCAANNSVVSYPAVPKSALQAVAQSCRPVCLSLKIPRFDWTEEDILTIEPWLLNDSPDPFDGCTAVIELTADGKSGKIAECQISPAPANTNHQGASISFSLPKITKNEFTLTIYAPDNPALKSEYRLLYSRANTAEKSFR